MDIAKIRKKLKKTEPADSQESIGNSQQSIVESEKLEESELKYELKKVEPEIKEETEAIELLSFGLLREEFAFKVSQIEEILRHQRITKVPKMPTYMLGITSLRGKVIPVIDLKLRLSFKERPLDLNHKGKILILKGPQGPIGAAIDRVIGVVRLSRSEIIPPPSHLTETELKFIEGIAIVDKRFISIIRMEEAMTIQLNDQ